MNPIDWFVYKMLCISPSLAQSKTKPEGLEARIHTFNKKIWTLKFDESRSKQGSEASVELVNPKGKSFLSSYWL